MRLTLPWPPSVNAYWRIFRNRILLSREARDFKANAASVAKRAALTPRAGPVVVTVWAFRPRRIGDLDNTLKATLDSLRGVVFVDDSQVVELHAFRRDDKENPRVEVQVEPAE